MESHYITSSVDNQYLVNIVLVVTQFSIVLNIVELNASKLLILSDIRSLKLKSKV